MAQVNTGLREVAVAPVPGGGGMATTGFVVIQATVIDTATLTTEDATVTDFNIEEQDTPIYTTSVPGKKTFNWSSYDMTPDNIVVIAGGTVTTDASGNDKWNAPASQPTIIKSMRLITLNGSIFEFPKVKITAAPNWAFQKSGLQQWDITADILTPDNPAVSAYSYTQVNS